MASGRLGAADLTAAVNTTIYTVPASTVATVSINVCNRNNTSVTVRIAHLDGAIGTLGNEDYIEYDTTIPSNGILERTGIVMAATHTIMAYSPNSNVSVQVYGFEETA